MEEVITIERMIDFIIVVMAIEMLVLLFIKQKNGRGPQIGEYVPHQLAGLFLLLALRNALTSSSQLFIAASLLGALICHLIYLQKHWRAPSRISFPKEPSSRQNPPPKSKQAEEIKTKLIKIGTQP